MPDRSPVQSGSRRVRCFKGRNHECIGVSFQIQLGWKLHSPLHFPIVETFVGEHILDVTASATTHNPYPQLLSTKSRSDKASAGTIETYRGVLTPEHEDWSGSYYGGTRQYPPWFHPLAPTRIWRSSVGVTQQFTRCEKSSPAENGTNAQ